MMQGAFHLVVKVKPSVTIRGLAQSVVSNCTHRIKLVKLECKHFCRIGIWTGGLVTKPEVKKCFGFQSRIRKKRPATLISNYHGGRDCQKKIVKFFKANFLYFLLGTKSKSFSSSLTHAAKWTQFLDSSVHGQNK